jgi:hypothetical protein
MKMQYYALKLRLSGSPMNEVRDVFSAPEVLIMQYIHGVDAISDIKVVKDERIVNMRDFKDSMKAKYDQSLTRRNQSIDKIFGALGQLPTTLPDDLLEMHDLIDEDDVVAVAKNVTKQAKRSVRTDIEQRRLDLVVPSQEVDIGKVME